MSEDTPDWKAIFEANFHGASVISSRNDKFLSLVGFDVETLNYLWTQYGERVYVGKRRLNSLQFMWFLSFLRTGLQWNYLSLMWRVSVTTLRRVVNDCLIGFDTICDEVQNQLCFIFFLFFLFLTLLIVNRSTGTIQAKTCQQRDLLRGLATLWIALS